MISYLVVLITAWRISEQLSAEAAALGISRALETAQRLHRAQDGEHYDIFSAMGKIRIITRVFAICTVPR